MASIKKNFFYSSILTVSGYIFPLLTFPYVTRVLGVNNIGVCNFVDSIVQYFTIFSMLGISTVGMREIAKAKTNSNDLSTVFSSLFALNFIVSLVAISILLICTLCIPKLNEHRVMFYIGAAKILSNTFLVEWLFKGLENFKYITLRSVIIRALFVIAIFVFVRDENDYVIYFTLSALLVLVNAITNCLYGRRFVKFSIRKLSFSLYIKPVVILGCYLILTSMYTTFNVTYLGFASNDTEVGYYSVATKLYTIIMSLFTAFTGVMMPRMSSLLSEGNIREFKLLTNKSIDVLLAFALPIIVISESCSPQIINIIAGAGYEGSITSMRIVMPLMLIIGYEQIIVLQMLTPMRKDISILINSLVGASVGLIFNFLLVSRLGSKGSAIVWVISEVAVLCSAQPYVKKFIGYQMPWKTIIKRVLYYTPMLFASFGITRLIANTVLSLFIVSIITSLYCFFLEMCVIKNEMITNNMRRIIKFGL